MSERKSKSFLESASKNTTTHTHQDLCLKFAVDQCYSKFSRVIGRIKTTITLHNPIINNICLFVLKSLVGDLIIRTDFEERCKTVCFCFGDDQLALHLNAEFHELTASIVSNDYKRCYYPAIFNFIREDCKPIAPKQICCLKGNIDFTKTEVA